MDIIVSLPQQERPALLVIVDEPTHHIRVLWGIEKLPYSYANRTALDGHIVAFSRDVVAGNTPPTISIKEEWWEKEGCPVPTETNTNAEVSKLHPRDTRIPEAAPGVATISITQACITPLALAHPLLSAPYLSPADAYTLLAARVHAWKWDAPIKPLMTWLRASLYATCLGVTSTPPLDLANHITVSLQKLQIDMVPHTPSGKSAPPPTYIIQSLPADKAAPTKKLTQRKGGTYKPLPCTDSPTYKDLKTSPTSGKP